MKPSSQKDKPNLCIMVKLHFRLLLIQLFILLLSVSYSQENTETVTSSDSLANQDYSVQSQPIQFNRIQQMPFRSVYWLALNSPNTYYLKGNQLVVDGIRSSGNDIFIEGMQVSDGEEFPFRAIAQYQHYRSNQPIRYGNVSGSIIELKTPVYKDRIHFDLDGYMSTNRETLKNNAVELNVGGPIRFGKNKDKKGFTPLFYLASNYTFTNDPNPSWENKYKATEETQGYLTQNPLIRTGNAFNSTYYSAEFLRNEETEAVNYHQNADRKKWNTFLKFLFPITRNINLSVGSYAKIDDGKEFVFDNALLNSHNNPETYYQNFDNYLNFDHQIKLNSDLSIGYNVNFQYSNYYFRRQDARHQDRYFEYGYLGKYQTSKIPSYELGSIEIDGENYDNVQLLNSWDNDTAYTFQDMDFNPEEAKFTEQIYELFPVNWEGGNNGNWSNSDQLQLRGGLLNGQNPNEVYGLWNSQGDISSSYQPSPMGNFYNRNSYGYRQSEKYRGTFQFDLDYKEHNFFAGFEYLKDIQRSYEIKPNDLWNRMRGLTNFHIRELDLSNPIFVNDNGVFQDTINFFRKYDEGSQFEFDKNLRKKLGLEIDGVDFILTDSYDMVNHTIDYYDKDGVMHTIKVDKDLFSLDLFAPVELLNDGQYVVNYMGYDYQGNKIRGKQNPYDAYTNWQVDAYSPSYFSAFIGDNFSWKFFDVSAGLRLDHFNANQPVLKDKYSLYEIYTKAEISNCNPGPHPDNIGDDYAVYVDNVNNPTEITGYRSGDTWYDYNGKEIDDPSLLDRGSGVSPYLVDKDAYIGSVNWTPDMTFEDYKPITYFLPQVNIDIKTHLVNAYVYYNSFSQNPTSMNTFRPFDYLFINRSTGVLNNPALKPIRTDKVSVGVQPRVYKNLYADIGYQGAFVKNNYYMERIEGAYPREYRTILNNEDYMVSNNLILSLNYFSQKYTGIGAGASLTKSFDWGSEKEELNKPDWIFNSHATFNFGYGKDFILPQNKVLNAIFGNFGIGIYQQVRSGTKLPDFESEAQNYFETPNFSFFNLRVEKGVYIKPVGLTVSFYVWIENLFNKQNLFYIDPLTGQPDDDGYLSSPWYQQEIESQIDPEAFRQLYQMKLYNPAYYDTPRICRVGLIIKM